MSYDASLLPGGSSLSEEQESLLALFLEKDDFAIENVEKNPVITLRPEDRYRPFPLTDIQLAYSF